MNKKMYIGYDENIEDFRIGSLEEINSYGYTIRLSRKNNQIYTKIKEWRT